MLATSEELPLNPLKWRKRAKELERRLEEIEAERDIPTLYNEYPDSPESRVPLGQVGCRDFQALKDATIDEKIACASDVLASLDNVNYFTVYVETTEGIFVRTIEKDAKRDFIKDAKRFQLMITWAPINAGRTLRVLDTAVVYKGSVMNRIYRLHGTGLIKGDQLRITYTFES